MERKGFGLGKGGRRFGLPRGILDSTFGRAGLAFPNSRFRPLKCDRVAKNKVEAAKV